MGDDNLTILIVEDDAIIGQSLRSCLRKAGYMVSDSVSNGEDALDAIRIKLPDLILMDIALDGGMDGISTAQEIRSQYDIPIVYLTAYADEETLTRAKGTDPYGYVLKPYEERILLVTLEMAFNKYELQKRLKQSEEKYRLLVENQSEGVTIVDQAERFVFANPAADRIFGVEPGGLIGRTVADFTSSDQYAEIRTQSDHRRNGMITDYEIIINRLDGNQRYIAVTAAPWLDPNGAFAGTLGILRDITEKKRAEQAEQEQRALADALRDTAILLSSTLHLDEVLDRILVIIERVVPHDAANIMLMDDDGWTWIARTRGFDELKLTDYIQSLRLHVDETPNFKRMRDSRMPVVLPDVQLNKEWIVPPGLESFRSYVGAPIIVKGKVIGYLNLDSRIPGYFSQKDADHLFAFAGQAAMAIENAQLFDETRGRADFLSLLHKITEIGLKSTSLDEMLYQVIDIVMLWFGADGANITHWDDEKKQPLPGAASEAYGPAYYALRTRPGEVSLTESCLKKGTVLVVKDVFNSKYVSPELAARFTMHSFMVLPLIADGRKLGAMLIGFFDRHQFTEEETVQGRQIADQTALAIAKALLVDSERYRSLELQRANALITSLSHVAARIEAAALLGTVVETLGEELEKINLMSMLILQGSGGQEVTIHYPSPFLNDPERLNQLENLTVQDINRELQQSGILPLAAPIREPLFFVDTMDAARQILAGLTEQQVRVICDLAVLQPGTRGVLLPLKVADQQTGLLWLWGTELIQADIPALTIFAGQVATTLENARLYRELHHLAMTDELTGLLNRRRLFEMARVMVTDAIQDHRNFSLIITDTDEFKAINDKYGHPVGDEVICALANRCNQKARKVDFLGRYGGDEFILLLPGTTLEDTIHVAERIRKEIGSTPIVTSAGAIPVTISLGVASVQCDEDTVISLLIRADKALYVAKQKGGNLVIAGKLTREGPIFEIHRPLV